MAKQVVLLLTGTVNPNNMSFTKLLDADSRKAQYIEAIRFWLGKVDFPIVFVENSGCSLAPYFKEEIIANKLQVFDFDGNNYARELGKGYGELLCLEHAYNRSEKIRSADFVFKVTGRHKILNFSSFLKQYEQNAGIQVMVNFYEFLKRCDSKFFGFIPSFIPDYLVTYKDVVNDSNNIFFENILSSSVHQAIAKGYNFRPLENLPRVEGSSGTFGIDYNSSYFSWLRHNTAYLFRNSIFK